MPPTIFLYQIVEGVADKSFGASLNCSLPLQPFGRLCTHWRGSVWQHSAWQKGVCPQTISLSLLVEGMTDATCDEGLLLASIYRRGVCSALLQA